MTFRGKALAFSLTIGLMAVVLAGTVAVSLHLIARDDDRLNRVTRFGADVRSAETLASEILLGGGERAYSQWNSLSESLRKDLRNLADLPFATQGLIDELASRLASMDRTFTRLATLPEGNAQLARSILATRIQADKGALVSWTAAIEAEVRATQAANLRLAAVANVAVIACLLILAVAHHLIMRRFLSGAWKDLTDAIGQLEAGHLTAPIVSERRDEFGQMLQALEAMRTSLQAKIAAEDTARREAEQLSQLKSRFIASVSHELRTPLMGLLGMVDLAARRQGLEEIKADLVRAGNAGQHLMDVINQILDFSKIEANKLELAAAPFDPDATIRVVESVFAAQAAEKGLKLELQSPRSPSPKLLGDQQRLSQVLFNLVGNAVKFTDAGTVTISYDVSPIGDAAARLRVKVADTGPGIPKDARQHIFKDFFQVPLQNTSGKHGTGLGLAISARLVNLMGGTIGLEPETDKGAQFFVQFDLPVADADAAPAKHAAVVRPAVPLQILVAEDVETNRIIVREILVAEGHEVDAVENGRDCLERLHGDQSYDVVLMDINMPVMDGIAATRAIRAATEPWRDIPIVGLTANAFEDQVRTYIEAGMNACIPKPVRWHELLAGLAAATGTGRSEPADAPTAQVVASKGQTPLLDDERLREMLQLLGSTKLALLIERSSGVLAESSSKIATVANDPDRLRPALHELRGAAANLGCLRLAEEVMRAEDRAAAGHVNPAEIRRLPSLVTDSLAAARDWIDAHAAA